MILAASLEKGDMPAQSIIVLKLLKELLTRDYATVQAFLAQALRKTKSLVDFDMAFIGVVEIKDGQSHVVVRDKHRNIVGAQLGGEWENYLSSLPVGGEALPRKKRSFAGYVAATRRPKWTGDVTKEEFYRQSNREIRSEIAVPIMLESDDLLGVINLESKVPGFYKAKDVSTLQLIARLIAPRLFRMLSRDGHRRSHQSVIDSMIAAVDAVPVGVLPETGATLSSVAGLIGRSLDSRSCTIWLLDNAGDTLILRGAYGPHRRFAHIHKEKRREPLTLAFCHRTCRKKRRYMKAARSKKQLIRLFAIDDDPLRRTGITAIIESNPDRDIELVGQATRNSPDLPDKVLASDANVVLIDGALEPGRYFKDIVDDSESSGVLASLAIRKKLGARVKIILCSQYPAVQKEFDRSGADQFAVINMEPHEFRQMIRDVYGNKKVEQPMFGEIMRIRIDVRDRRLVLRNGAGRHAATTRITGFRMVFLHYLAQERKELDHGWIYADGPECFKLKRCDKWQENLDEYCRREDGGKAACAETVMSQDLSTWAARINDEVMSLAVGITGPLIKGPGGGRRRTYRGVDRTYALNSTIKEAMIVK